MNIFEDRGGGKLHWKLNLYVLWVCVFFTCASYTMCVPFLPVYLLQHLGVARLMSIRGRALFIPLPFLRRPLWRLTGVPMPTVSASA